jgi:LysR family transcriptional regulator, regulator for bpeEF and oprC
MMDKLIAMQTFALVAELSSFSKAAEALRVPNATVSTRVSQLEANLQVQLLLRTTRRLTLTEDGTAYLVQAQRLLQDLKEIESRVTGDVASPKGRLRIDVPAAVGRHVLAPHLPEFFKRHPGITLDIGSSDRPVDLVTEGVDCVIRGGAVHDKQLVARKLGAFEIITCASPAYLKAHGLPKTLEDLRGDKHRAVNFFSAKNGRAFSFDFEKDGQVRAVMLPHNVSANDADTQVALCVQGLGLMQYPRTNALQHQLDSGALVQVLRGWSAGSLSLYVMYPRNRYLSARLRVFVDWVVVVYAEKFAVLGAAALQQLKGRPLRRSDKI